MDLFRAILLEALQTGSKIFSGLKNNLSKAAEHV